MTTLTVRGVRWAKRDGDFDFERADATVTIGATTAVTEEGQMGKGAVALDATAGQVQLDITPVWRTVFVTQLALEMNGTTAVNAVAAAGQYDAAMNVFTAKRPSCSATE